MNSEDFNKCREFLEKSLESSPENNELLNAYVKLLELKSKYDTETDKALIEKEIRESELQANYQTAVHTNNTNYNTASNQNFAENYRHDQTQMHGTVQTAMNTGHFPQQPLANNRNY